MIKKYIDNCGNWAMLETTVDANRESKIELIGTTYFQRKIEEVKPEKKQKVVKKEIKEEVIETPVDEEPIYDESELKEFLKSKKVRGYALLRWEWLIKKALEQGFTINK